MQATIGSGGGYADGFQLAVFFGGVPWIFNSTYSKQISWML